LNLTTAATQLQGFAAALGLVAWIEPSSTSVYLFARNRREAKPLVIRLADHATVSHRHPAVAINVAPGRDTVAEAKAALTALAWGDRLGRPTPWGG